MSRIIFSHTTSPAIPPTRQPFKRLLRPIFSVALLALFVALAACGGSGAPSGTGASSTQSPAASPTARPAVVYVAMGASDAVGVGASNPNTTAYVPILISRLPKGSSALNLGVSGYTVRQALSGELPQAISAQPTLVTVWLVGNDFKNCVSLAQYGADLNTLLGQLQTKTHAKVFVANAPDMSLLPAIQRIAAQQGGFCGGSGSQTAIRARVVAWNNVIASAVSAHHDYLVNLYNSDLVAHPDYIYSDGFHPSDKGYLALANLFWQQITAHGGVPASSGA